MRVEISRYFIKAFPTEDEKTTQRLLGYLKKGKKLIYDSKAGTFETVTSEERLLALLVLDTGLLQLGPNFSEIDDTHIQFDEVETLSIKTLCEFVTEPKNLIAVHLFNQIHKHNFFITQENQEEFVKQYMPALVYYFVSLDEIKALFIAAYEETPGEKSNLGLILELVEKVYLG